ncbi:stearoyl-CoA desaturase 5-like [Watersipora subatra]|uniref:stearoyl-CoA desaturase 5-like n=1 Tax=Watersipora subatra TaxID=2589382 RepID=UPI00355C981F
MAPKDQSDTVPPLCEEDIGPQIEWVPEEVEARPDPVQTRIVWRNVVIFSILHLACVYGLFLIPSAKPLTWLFNYVMFLVAAVSVTAGAHRLWSHRSYKAKLPLRIMLMLFNFAAGQNHLIEWCRDHRVHHKYSETTADPHNAKRGFFFAHVGWLLCKKHPDVIRKGKQLDFSDLYGDPVLRFQCRVYIPMTILMIFVMPTVLPWLLWNESLWVAYFLAITRYILTLNATWLVNSAAHMWGMRPYDKHISPAENVLVTIGAIGEGFHNYHHTFPNDYATSEFGSRLNFTTIFINLMAKIGWAYDLKTMSKEVIEARKRRTGCLSSESKPTRPLQTMANSNAKQL